jgi:hypothetical protein
MASLRFDEGPFGLSWILDEPMTRSCHALAGDDGRVWLVDPVDEPEAMARAAALGEPAAVVQLLDRHNRDCAEIAARLGVPHVRAWDEAPGAPFQTIRVLDWPKWKEAALWWPERSTLVVAEAVGTNPVWAAGPGEVGVHPMLRMVPPGALRGSEPEHLLVGHGPGVHGPGASAALQDALARSRRDIPRALVKLPKLRP